MRKILLSSAIVLAMGSASFAGHAAESATLSLKGSITPGACDVSLSAASVDFGKIPASTLTDAMNQIKGTPVTVSVDCDAATAVAVQTVDNRASSAMTLSEIENSMGATFASLTDASVLGLGNDGSGNKVGAMMLAITGATLNGTADSNILVSSDKSAWTMKTISPTASHVLVKDGYFALGATASSTTPAAVTKASYTLQNNIFLKKSDKYPSGEQVNIDGNVTFSVVYL